MAKKSARKEITKINLKQAALEGLSYERACETAKRAGKPSYRFTVGDKVQVGYLLNCVVDEALEGGYMYLIRSGANSDNYSCWAWTNVRPLDDNKDTHFAKRNSALSRLHYSNRSMYSLLSFQYLFGVDFNPDYCAMPSNTRTAIVGLLHDYCLKNQRSLDDLTEFEYLGPAEKADSPA